MFFLCNNFVYKGVPKAKRGEIWVFLAKQHDLHSPPEKEQQWMEKTYHDIKEGSTCHQHSIFIDLGKHAVELLIHCHSFWAERSWASWRRCYILLWLCLIFLHRSHISQSSILCSSVGAWPVVFVQHPEGVFHFRRRSRLLSGTQFCGWHSADAYERGGCLRHTSIHDVHTWCP